MAIKWLSSGETGYVAIDSTTHRIRHFCESNSSLVYLWHTLQQHVFWALLPSTVVVLKMLDLRGWNFKFRVKNLFQVALGSFQGQKP